MTNPSIPHEYSRLQAWIQDRVVAERALHLHAYILEHGKLAAILSRERDRTLLDVGCGGGQSAIRLRELYPHLQITGIDLSEDMIASARKRAHHRGLAIHFQVADAQALPFPDASFDVVFSFGSAKHWADPLRGLGECWRVLKPGGELLVADATSDATPEEVENFYAIAGFPRLLQKPVAALLYRRMFRPARAVLAYRQIADQLRMPPGTVGQVPSMPAFLFRTQKPSAQ
jgi:ubiquinone/menaquinone biosynthesis C-methylase UbiE